jgi:hypothetical protein
MQSKPAGSCGVRAVSTGFDAIAWIEDVDLVPVVEQPGGDARRSGVSTCACTTLVMKIDPRL